MGEGGGGWRVRENTYQIAHYALLCVAEEVEDGREVMNAPWLLLGPGHLFAVFKEISAQWSSRIKGQNNDHCSSR